MIILWQTTVKATTKFMINLCLNQDLKNLLRSNMGEFDARSQGNPELRRAAVALTLVNAQCDPEMDGLAWSSAEKSEAAIILTRRSAKLNKHAGQWALPGGRMDQGETPEQSALRELEEEVGLQLEPSDIIGRLDDYPTRSGFSITPVVVWGGSNPALVPNPGEVDSIHCIPVREFMREDAPLLEQIPESEHPVLRMPVGDSWIAAPTAALVYQFREVAVLGQATRVAHFEQPYFAWR